VAVTDATKVDLGKPLAGRTAIVTGSGQNIGKAIALHFARAGANVIVNGHRNQAAIDAVVKEIEALGVKGLACLADVSDAKAVSDMVKKGQDKFGGVDIAVSNVSVRLHQPFFDISLEDWDKTLKSNLSSAFYLARAALPGMQKAKWGRIIHISGEDGWQGHIPGRAHNMVCKAGVHAFSKAVGIEFASDGITANTVSPGSIETTRDWSQYPKNWREMRLGQIPMKKIGRVDDIAMACVYLAGDSGAFISGQVIHVNGGQFMY
jgi:NAD(P)-dependent dehydrogenase (short-subunit alcohol dehydrogenase family)